MSKITVLRSRGRRLAKVVHADGRIADYDKVRIVDMEEVDVCDIDALGALLRSLDRRPDCAIVRGAIADSARTKGVRRLLYPDGDDAPTLKEVPREWVALDFDGVPRPDWVKPNDLLACGVVAIETLPEEFRDASCVVQATSSHGLKPGVRLRLWFWLSRPVSGTELKVWLRTAPVDRSIFGAAQIIYTAAPIFKPGAFDPLTARHDVIPGDAAVPVPRPPRKRPRPPLPPSAESVNIDRLIRFVEDAPAGNRNASLYWAVCRTSEQGGVTEQTAELLVEAAVRAGLPAVEAMATVRSGLRYG